MERENFRSRLGFILISAGCAIGIGNVWRFPYMAGNCGGGFFVLLYLFFLVIMGVPILTMEYAVGRASRKSTAWAFHTLEKPGQKWHLMRYATLAGNFLLMMFYTTVAGWMLYYFYLMASGTFTGMDTQAIAGVFPGMLQKPGVMAAYTMGIIVAGFAVCSLGLQGGVERVSKWLMLALLGIMVVLAVQSLFLEGGTEGLKFYLLPSVDKMRETGIGKVCPRTGPCWARASWSAPWTPLWPSCRASSSSRPALPLASAPTAAPASSSSPCPTCSGIWPADGSGEHCSSCS